MSQPPMLADASPGIFATEPGRRREAVPAAPKLLGQNGLQPGGGLYGSARPAVRSNSPPVLRRHYMQEAQHRMQYAPVQGSEMVGMVDNNGHYSALYKKTQSMFVEVQAQPVMVDRVQAVQLDDAQPVRHLRPSHYWSGYWSG